MPAEAPGPRSGLEDWLRWQERVHPQGIVLGLERVRPVASRMGLPAAGIRTLTVAGTNGKGSTVSILTAIVRAAGHRVGTYTSPHLLRYNERVSVDGVAVPDATLCAAFAEVEKARDTIPLTYFEFGTLAALHVFREARVVVQVLEVGLGGRLDAVNLVDADCAVVTSLGLDHTEYLGNTLDEIAREKAGIARAGRPVVLSDPARPGSLDVEVERIGALPRRPGHEFECRRAGDNWHWRGERWHFRKLPPPALPGEIQYMNAAGAIAALEALPDGLAAEETAIRAGLAGVQLAARFERHGATVLDVAHNVEAARVLAANLRAANIGRLHLVLGMLADKPVRGFVAALPAAVRIHAASLPPPRGLPAAELIRRLGPVGVPCEAHESPEAAWRAARSEALEGDTILVSGSFLTVAAIQALLK